MIKLEPGRFGAVSEQFQSSFLSDRELPIIIINFINIITIIIVIINDIFGCWLGFSSSFF